MTFLPSSLLAQPLPHIPSSPLPFSHSLYPIGLTTTSRRSDLEAVRSALTQELSPLEVAGLYPELDQIENLALSMPNASFEEVSAMRWRWRGCTRSRTRLRTLPCQCPMRPLRR